EDRQERRHRQQIGHRDPAHGAQSRTEFELEPRKQHLRDAGIDLAHESADAHAADDEPAIGLRRATTCAGGGSWPWRSASRSAAIEAGPLEPTSIPANILIAALLSLEESPAETAGEQQPHVWDV